LLPDIPLKIVKASSLQTRSLPSFADLVIEYCWMKLSVHGTSSSFSLFDWPARLVLGKGDSYAHLLSDPGPIFSFFCHPDAGVIVC